MSCLLSWILNLMDRQVHVHDLDLTGLLYSILVHVYHDLTLWIMEELEGELVLHCETFRICCIAKRDPSEGVPMCY